MLKSLIVPKINRLIISLSNPRNETLLFSIMTFIDSFGNPNVIQLNAQL